MAENNKITPSGYAYGSDPKAWHPFWEDESEDKGLQLDTSILTDYYEVTEPLELKGIHFRNFALYGIDFENPVVISDFTETTLNGTTYTFVQAKFKNGIIKPQIFYPTAYSGSNATIDFSNCNSIACHMYGLTDNIAACKCKDLKIKNFNKSIKVTADSYVNGFFIEYGQDVDINKWNPSVFELIDHVQSELEKNVKTSIACSLGDSQSPDYTFSLPEYRYGTKITIFSNNVSSANNVVTQPFDIIICKKNTSQATPVYNVYARTIVLDFAVTSSNSYFLCGLHGPNIENIVINVPIYPLVLRSSGYFSGTKIESGEGSIYVPDDLVDQYKQASNWVEYANVIKPISEYKGDLE